MKKLFTFVISVLMIFSLAVSVSAATDEPVITMNPQSPYYTEYAVAIYTVKVEGKNLSATWFIEYDGKTYDTSKLGGAMQPWEAFAGEAYGPKKLDANTFAFVFEGIGFELNGSYIWCTVEDGHYDVTTPKTRISVGNEFSPPEILEMPTELTVEQGDLAEIRCVAKAPEGTQLSYIWYETETGDRKDMVAVNDGKETSDHIICDTSKLGKRNYLCVVSTSDGGVAHSSVVPVTVIEKQVVENGPSEPNDTESKPTVSDPDNTSSGSDIDPKPDDPKADNGGFPWLIAVIAAVLAAGIGFTVAFIIVKKKKY